VAQALRQLVEQMKTDGVIQAPLRVLDRVVLSFR
jgi:hypothetical protein